MCGIYCEQPVSGRIRYADNEHDYPGKHQSFSIVGTGLVPVLLLCLFMERSIATWHPDKTIAIDDAGSPHPDKSGFAMTDCEFRLE
jgi:hypothetical protein